MGIFPGTFISRKMIISTFSQFLFSWPTHGCTNTKFSVNATKRLSSWTFIADDRLCAGSVCAEQKKPVICQLNWAGKAGSIVLHINSNIPTCTNMRPGLWTGWWTVHDGQWVLQISSWTSEYSKPTAKFTTWSECFYCFYIFFIRIYLWV